MTDVIDRISHLMNLRGVKARSLKPTLARVCGISYQAVSQWFDGSTSNIKNEHLMALAEEYDTTVDWLLSGKGEAPQATAVAGKPKSPADLVREMLTSKSGGLLSEEARQRILAAAEEPSEVVAADEPAPTDLALIRVRPGELSIPQYDVRGSMGHGQLPDEYVRHIRNVIVSEELIHDLGLKYTEPRNLCFMTGSGQSMEGTINDKSPLLVDRGVQSFIGDGVYAFTWNDLFQVKRLQMIDAEHVAIISDNPSYQPVPARIDDLYVHARVLVAWNARKL